jgi:hypothetical protein
MTPRTAAAAVVAGRCRRTLVASSSSCRRQSSLSYLPSWQQQQQQRQHGERDENDEATFWSQQAHEEPFASHHYRSLVEHQKAVASRHNSYHSHHLVRERPAHVVGVVNTPLHNAMTNTAAVSLDQFIHEIPHWLWYRQRCKIPAGSPMDPVLQQCRYVRSAKPLSRELTKSRS